MLSRLRRNALAIAMSALGIISIGWLGFYAFAWNDYENEAKPSVDALISGHVLAALQSAPAYGGSLIIRAPFALLPDLWGGGAIAVYRMLALPCLVAAAAVAIVVVGGMREDNRSLLARAVLLALFVANPIMIRAGELGHPEELLSAACVIAAVLAAMKGRTVWAGVLLGLAIANKEWALVASGPVLLALPAGRVKALAIAAIVAGAILSPLLLAGGGFATQLHAAATVASGSPIFQPWQVWWFLGPHGHHVRFLYGYAPADNRAAVGWAVALSHPLIVAAGVPLTLLAARMRRNAHTPLLLLALLLLLRAELDVWDNIYYCLPFILALATWEVRAHACPPVGALAATALTWVSFVWAPDHLSADRVSLFFLALALPTTVVMLAALYAPSRLRVVGAALASLADRARGRSGRRPQSEGRPRPIDAVGGELTAGDALRPSPTP
jgi:hypothetical protein